MRMLDAILDFLFPPRCEGCRKEGTYLCDACLYVLPRAKPTADRWIAALYDYRSPPVQGALWKLKYRGVSEIAGLFGKILYDLALADAAEEKVWKNIGKISLVPIPLSEMKEKQRGYNQAELIAKAMAAEDAETLFSFEPGLLTRIKDGKSQMSVRNREERERNVRGAFAAHEAAKGRRIIIVDDITTTGATLREARAALLAAGARDVTAVAVAH